MINWAVCIIVVAFVQCEAMLHKDFPDESVNNYSNCVRAAKDLQLKDKYTRLPRAVDHFTEKLLCYKHHGFVYDIVWLGKLCRERKVRVTNLV